MAIKFLFLAHTNSLLGYKVLLCISLYIIKFLYDSIWFCYGVEVHAVTVLASEMTQVVRRRLAPCHGTG
jgi:hypothetical protein